MGYIFRDHIEDAVAGAWCWATGCTAFSALAPRISGTPQQSPIAKLPTFRGAADATRHRLVVGQDIAAALGATQLHRENRWLHDGVRLFMK